MRLIGLHVDGFGKLSDFRCSFDAPITVIYGRNEAGKSTTLSFIRTMLYGFATRANPSERLEPAAGGRHGGRLFFRGSGGESYVLERYANAPGRVIVRPFYGANEAAEAELPHEYSSLTETLPQTAWEQRFLGGVSDRVFRQLFAITLTELQAIGMLEGDELGKQLYHAGWGGGAAIARTEKQLGSSLDDLFRPRGSNQQINRLLKSLEKTEAELRGLGDGISVYNELTEALAATESQLQEAEGRLPELRERAMLLARACDNWPLWVERLAMTRERETLAMAARLPADIRAKWDLHTAEREKLLGDLQRIRLSIESIEREIALLSYDDKIIARTDEIETLLMSVDRISSFRLERKEMEAELREHNDALERLAMRISPDWTEEQLRSLRVTVAERETARETRAAMLGADKGLERADAELRKVREQASETAAQIEELEAAGTGDRRWNGNEPMRLADAQGEGRRAASERLELLPETPEALRLAARAFEDAWRELELERLRAESDTPSQTAVFGSGAEAANRRGRAALWLAAGAVAAAAVLLGAAGWRTAAVAAGAAAAAFAAPALLSRLRPRAARPAAPGAGGGAIAGRRGNPPRSAAGAEAAAAAAARLAAAERRAAAALSALVREPEAALAELLAANPAGSGQHNAPGSRSGRPPGGGSGGAVAAQQAAMQAFVQEAAATSSDGKPAFIQRLRTLIDARLDELLFSEHRLNARQELSRRLMRIRALESERQALAAEAADRADAIAARWRSWLAHRALPTSLSPEAAIETFDLAEQGIMRLQARDRIVEKSAVLGSEVGIFEAAVKSLHASFPAVESGAGSGDMAVTLKLLKAELQKHSAARSRAEELNERLVQLKLQALEQEAALERLYSRQRQWFDRVEAADETRWLEAIGQSERLYLIDSTLYKLDAQLTAGVSAQQRERLTQWYEEYDAHQLEQMKSEAETAYAAEEERRSVLLEQSGRQRQRLEQLMRDNDRRRLIAEREQTTAALEQLIHRYAVMSVAMTMIKRTKRIMEEQRQPAVLREASRYLSTISGGKYIRISMQHGEQRIRLETADGQSVDSIFLSRGTAEQLYLSMRFALADEAAAKVDLPMILDDLFVNFDRPRLEGAIDVMKELSTRRQLVLLTCHDHVRDLLVEKLPGAALVRLS